MSRRIGVHEMKTYYSTDDEYYCHETLGDVFDALVSDGRLMAGTIYWEADFQPMETQQALSAAWVLDEADEKGYDLIGESWDSPFSVSRDAQLELQSMLDAWAAKHVDVSHYYTIVGKPRQMTVTEADLLAIRAESECSTPQPEPPEAGHGP